MQPSNGSNRPTVQSKKGNNTHKSNKHQNQKSFKVMNNPYLQHLNDNADLSRLCQTCLPKIKWKLQMGKFKPKTQAGKCNVCDLKTVVKAYRHVCDKCCSEKSICSKCCMAVERYHSDSKVVQSHMTVSKEENAFNSLLHKLMERSRRKVLRLREQGLCKVKDDKYWNTANDLEVSHLHWRKDRGEDDEGESGDEGDSEGDEESEDDDKSED